MEPLSHAASGLVSMRSGDPSRGGHRGCRRSERRTRDPQRGQAELRDVVIPEDGRKLSARGAHPAGPLLRGAGCVRPRAGAHLRPSLDLCRPRRDARRAGRLFPGRHCGRKHHRAARSVGRAKGVLQRVPPSRHPAVRSDNGPALRNDSMSLSRVDLRARRPAARCAAYARSRGVRQEGLSATLGYTG